MMLVAVVAIAALAVWNDGQRREVAHQRHTLAGETAAAWFLAAHRATQENDFRARIAGGGIVIDPAAEGAAPPGLPAVPAVVTGVIDDGAGVPMAFVVAAPSSLPAAPAFAAGARAAGMAALETAASPGPMAAHVPAIEQALGRTLDGQEFYATADAAVAPRSDRLYRRAQPGRPWLNRMEAGLSGTAVAAAAVNALSASATGIASAGSLDAGGDLGAASMTADSLEARRFEAAGLAVTAGLAVGTLTADGAAAGASAQVTGRLQAASATAGALSAQELVAATSVTATGAATGDDAVAGTATTPGPAGTGSTVARWLGGPALNVAGELTVLGSCDGCRFGR